MDSHSGSKVEQLTMNIHSGHCSLLLLSFSVLNFFCITDLDDHMKVFCGNV